jgi:hypothetical protein
MIINPKAPRPGSIEAKDDFSAAPPGYGLTLDNEQWAWGKPPQQVNPDVVLEQAIATLKKPRIKSEMVKLLMVGASVEALVEGYIFQGFQEGKFNPDVGLLIKGPLALYIANMAEEEGVPYRFFENDNVMEKNEMDDRTFFTMMKQNNPAMFAYIKENLNEGIRKGMRPMDMEDSDEGFMKVDVEEQD